MVVEVKLYGLFKQYAPSGKHSFQFEIAQGSKIRELLNLLKIPCDQARVLLVNSRRNDIGRGLEPGDTVVLFSPIEGG